MKHVPHVSRRFWLGVLNGAALTAAMFVCFVACPA